jgi:hypothetical protein
MADGCVSVREVIVVLQRRNCDHLRAFLEFLGCGDRPIASANGGRGGRITVCSAELARQLAQFGLTPNRKAEPVPEELATSPDFWRGLVDGDGSLKLTPPRGIPQLEVVGNPAHIRQLAEFFHRTAPSMEPPRPFAHSQSKRVLMLSLSGRRAKAAVQTLYYHGAPDALARKLQLAHRIMDWSPSVIHRYPWDDWANGETWTLIRDRDYMTFQRVWERARKVAAERNLRLAMRDGGQHLTMRFLARGPEAADT